MAYVKMKSGFSSLDGAKKTKQDNQKGKKTMKRMLVLSLVVMVTAVLLAPNAEAGGLKNAGQNTGRALLCPLKAVARVAVAAIDTVTLKKPAAVLSAPKIVRQEAVDVVESLARCVANKKPIPKNDVGNVNTAISEAKADWLVDGVVYGVATGVVVHNGNDVGAIHHVGKAAATAVGVAVSADLVEECAD